MNACSFAYHGNPALMLQFVFGILAGLLVGLVMEWIVDWQALMPKLGLGGRSSRSRTEAPAKLHSSHQASPKAVAESDSSAHRE